MAELLNELNEHVNKMNFIGRSSGYLLVKPILSIEKYDLESIIESTDNSIQFSNNNLMMLEEIINILEPFYEISIKYQQETVVAAKPVVPPIVHLFTHLRDIKQNVFVLQEAY